jgi:hypothetical protein
VPRVVIAGHAFVQNLRRGHYELTVEAATNRRVAVAFDELVLASDPAKVGLQPALGRRNATEPLAAIRRICDGVECAPCLSICPR